MAHGVLIESMIQAKNIDALNRSVKAAVDIDGGNLIALTAPTTQGSQGRALAPTYYPYHPIGSSRSPP